MYGVNITMTQFNFGKNWSAYSSDVLDESKFKEARQSLIELIGELGAAAEFLP